jgi:cyclophilin family peptidyl-prolyl cis-trans isomerase
MSVPQKCQRIYCTGKEIAEPKTGDPTGTGKGGQSIWKREFEDEIVPQLKVSNNFFWRQHNTRGMVSMASRGKDSNASQFFITYAKQRYLAIADLVHWMEKTQFLAVL